MRTMSIWTGRSFESAGEGRQRADFTIWHGGTKGVAASPVAFSGCYRRTSSSAHCFSRGMGGALQELHERNLRGARPQFRRKTAAPHLCRHTFATNYLINGGDVFTLQQILGHTTLEMVRRYVTLASSQVTVQHRKFSPMDRLTLARKTLLHQIPVTGSSGKGGSSAGRI